MKWSYPKPRELSQICSNLADQKRGVCAIRVILRSDKEKNSRISASNCSTPTFWFTFRRNFCGFSPTVQFLHFCFLSGQHIKRSPAFMASLWWSKRHIRMPLLSFTYKCMFFLQIWSQKLTFWEKQSTQALPNKRERRLKRKVWNKKWNTSPAKLYPHILIKRLNNGWPKKHKRERKNSKEATCWCRANWSAAHRLSKASGNVKSTTDLSLSPLMWSNSGSFPRGGQRKRRRESEWELWCAIGSRPPAAYPSSEHKTTCCLSSFLSLPRREGKEEEWAEEERVAGQTVRGKGSKGPGCPGEGNPLLQQCPPSTVRLWARPRRGALGGQCHGQKWLEQPCPWQSSWVQGIEAWD